MISSTVDEELARAHEARPDPLRVSALAARALVTAIAATSVALLVCGLVVLGQGVPGDGDVYSPAALLFNRFAAGALFPMLIASTISLVTTLVRLAKRDSRHPVNDLVLFAITIPISLAAYKIWAGMGW
jgi:hypothetical protein